MPAKAPFEKQAELERDAWAVYQAHLDEVAAAQLAERQAAEFDEPNSRSSRGARAEAAEEQAANEQVSAS